MNSLDWAWTLLPLALLGVASVGAVGATVGAYSRRWREFKRWFDRPVELL